MYGCAYWLRGLWVKYWLLRVLPPELVGRFGEDGIATGAYCMSLKAGRDSERSWFCLRQQNQIKNPAVITTEKAANDTPTAIAVTFVVFFATFAALLVAELVADEVVVSRVVTDEVVVDEVKEGSKMV